MEAQCDGCNKYFPKNELRVTIDGKFWCDPCRPRPCEPMIFRLTLDWRQINGLRDYLEGNTNLEILEIIDEVKYDIDYEILRVMRRVLKKDD